MNIIYNDAAHSYIVEQTKERLTSVSHVLSLLEEKYDANKSAPAYFEKYKDAKKKPDKWDNSWTCYQDVLDTWEFKNNKIRERGSKYHELREQNSNDKGAFSHVFKGEDKYAFSYSEMKNLKAGLYTEMIIPYLSASLIGTSDRIIIHEDKTFTIEDYKCIEDLQLEPIEYFSKEKKKVITKMFKILSHLPATKFNKYQIQLSMYAYFLECFGYKFKDGSLEQVFFNDNDEVTHTIKHPIQYLKKEVEILIKYYKSKNK